VGIAATTDGEAGESEVASTVASSPAAGVATLTGASLLRRGVLAAAGADVPVRGDAEPLLVSLDAVDVPWPERRDGDVVLVEPADAVDEASALDPAEPVVSAKATGIDATAEPTPRAMARAPTRPT
jgi:hypothetical protein